MKSWQRANATRSALRDARFTFYTRGTRTQRILPLPGIHALGDKSMSEIAYTWTITTSPP